MEVSRSSTGSISSSRFDLPGGAVQASTGDLIGPRRMHSGKHPHATSDDVEMMGRVKAGDPLAFQDLLNRYWPALTSYGATITGNTETARDLAQDAFTRLWERRHRWQESNSAGSLRNYLYLLVRNLAIDYLRKQKVRDRRASMVARYNTPEQVTPIQRLEREDLRDQIHHAIKQLPPRRREVFCLVHFHEMSYKQVADVMAISTQTVANQMSAALAELRRSLAPYLE